MNNAVAMDSLKGLNQASAEKFGLGLIEPPLTRQVESEITAQKQVHHQVKVFWVLKGIVCIHYELGLDHRK